MATIVLRSAGTPLTNAQVDANFTNINNEVATKLNTSSYTAADVLTKIKTVDGIGSGLDAELLGGKTYSLLAPGAFVIASVSRTSNVVTIVTTLAHGFSTSQTVKIFGVSDPSFNGTYTIASTPLTTTFTFAQTAANVGSTAQTLAQCYVTITSDSIPARDSSGVFSSPTLTALTTYSNLIGDVTGNISGNAANVTGIVAIANGGTGSNTAPNARTALGLGTIATQASNSVALTGGTINSTSVGATTPSTGAFTSLAYTSFTYNGVAITTTAAQFNYLSDVTSAIQAQFTTKAPLASPSFTTGISTPAITLNGTLLTPTAAQFNFVAGVSSNIQTQIDLKAPLAGPTGTGTATWPSYIGTATTDSTSTTTGAAIFAGGVGIAKNLWVGLKLSAQTLSVWPSANTLYQSGSTGLTLSTNYNAGTSDFTLATLSGTVLSVPQGTINVKLGANLNFANAGARITGDFSNATIASRTMFKTNTTNSATVIHTIPDGTGTTSQYISSNSSDTINCSELRMGAFPTQTAINSIIRGTGTLLPLKVQMNSTDALVVETTGLITISNSITIPTITAPTLLNSWVNYGGSQSTAGYWKDAYGVVHLVGFVKNGTFSSVIFTLPAGYRPTLHIVLATTANGTFGEIGVDNSGNVTHRQGSGTYISLDNITFRTT